MGQVCGASRAWALAALMAGILLGACERQETTSYDPRIDGLTAPRPAEPDLSILADKRGTARAPTPAPTPLTIPAVPTTGPEVTTSPASQTAPATMEGETPATTSAPAPATAPG